MTSPGNGALLLDHLRTRDFSRHTVNPLIPLAAVYGTRSEGHSRTAPTQTALLFRNVQGAS
jgi:hypothetical protein